MAIEHSAESLEVPPGLLEFIDRIEIPSPDEKVKQHLKDIVAMARDGALEKWKAKYLAHVAWHANKRVGERAHHESLPKELRSEGEADIRKDYPDEYYWLESAVAATIEEGYLSEKDEARTRFLLARAMTT